MPTPIDHADGTPKGAMTAYMQLASLGLMLLGVSEIAPEFLEPDASPTGLFGGLMHHSASIAKWNWLKIGVVASLIPLTYEVVKRYFARIPDKVVVNVAEPLAQRADVFITESSAQLDVSVSGCAALAEDPDWPNSVRQAGVAGHWEDATHEDSRTDWHGQDGDDSDHPVLPLQPVHAERTGDLHHRPEGGIVLSLEERTTRPRHPRGNKRRGRMSPSVRRRDEETSWDD